MAELADAQDLKSWVPKGACGFDSRPRHQDSPINTGNNQSIDDLRDLIITDYTNNGRKSLGDLKTTRLPRLDAVFGGTKATHRI